MSRYSTHTNTAVSRLYIGIQSVSLIDFDTSDDTSIAVPSGTNQVRSSAASVYSSRGTNQTGKSRNRSLLGGRKVLHGCCGAGSTLGRVAVWWMGSVDCDTHVLQIDGLEGSDD
jgi:hypothetical protein